MNYRIMQCVCTILITHLLFNEALNIFKYQIYGFLFFFILNNEAKVIKIIYLEN